MAKLKKTSNWHMNDGQIKPFNELETTHLANIIVFSGKMQFRNYKEVIRVCKEVLLDRGFSLSDNYSIQIPFTDADGDLALWDFEKERMVKLGEINENNETR